MLLEVAKNARGGKIKSQRLINAILEAKRKKLNITKEELEAVAFGFQQAGR